MQETSSFAKPVGSVMRPIPRVWTSASVSAAAAEIRDSGLPAVAVTEGFLYVNVVTQESLAAALAEGILPDDPIEKACDPNATSLPPYAPAERALELFTTHHVSAIPIVDDYGRLLGVVTPADLFPKRDKAPRPPAVGGMATPFGVYLTTGSVGAGASGWPLVVTGAALFTTMTIAATIVGLLPHLHGFAGVQHLANTLAGKVLLLEGAATPKTAKTINVDLLSLPVFLLFLGSFRLLPIAGIHAAEHKVVHAIERGEELTRENVRRMPRVHPRCGTNLAVGASLLLGICSMDLLIPDIYMRTVTALIVTLLFWRPLGSLVQRWFTTKEPTDKQIDMGISSGRELLKKYATGRGGRRGFFWRLWNSGLFHVMAGSSALFCLLSLIQMIFHIPIVPAITMGP